MGGFFSAKPQTEEAEEIKQSPNNEIEIVESFSEESVEGLENKFDEVKSEIVTKESRQETIESKSEYTEEEIAQYYYEQGYYAAQENQVENQGDIENTEVALDESEENEKDIKKETKIDTETELNQTEKNETEVINDVSGIEQKSLHKNKRVSFGSSEVFEYNKKDIIDKTVKQDESSSDDENEANEQTIFDQPKVLNFVTESDALKSFFKQTQSNNNVHATHKELDNSEEETIVENEFFKKTKDSLAEKPKSVPFKSNDFLELEEFELD